MGRFGIRLASETILTHPKTQGIENFAWCIGSVPAPRIRANVKIIRGALGLAPIVVPRDMEMLSEILKSKLAAVGVHV